MKEKVFYGIIFFTPLLFIVIASIFSSKPDLFMGLKPKATYGGYRIYDIVEQKGLACAQAIEILDSDDNYDYYFSCLKSNNIYFVSDKETIKVREAYKRGIISKEKLYELGIISRMVRMGD